MILSSSNTSPIDLKNEKEITIASNCSAVIISADVLHINLSENANLVHYRLVEEAVDTHLQVNQKKNSSYTSFSLYDQSCKDKMTIVLEEENARCSNDFLYSICSENKAVVQSEIVHAASMTTSSQTIKGLAKDQSFFNFEGCIHIQPNLNKIEGFQQHRGLLLSDKARIKALPKLEIFSDDVKCAHGSAIGALDQTQLFYLMSRGISESESKSLLLQAFLAEILDKISDEEMRQEFEKRILK